MDTKDVLALGLGIAPPWRLVGQRLDTPMATGWTSMRFGWTAYVVPFLFVFSPALLLQNDDVLVTVITIATAALGVWMVSSGMIGFFVRPMNFPVRAGFLLAGVLLTIPSEIGAWAAWTDAVGAVAGALMVLFEIRARRRHGAGALVANAGIPEN